MLFYIPCFHLSSIFLNFLTYFFKCSEARIFTWFLDASNRAQNKDPQGKCHRRQQCRKHNNIGSQDIIVVHILRHDITAHRRRGCQHNQNRYHLTRCKSELICNGKNTSGNPISLIKVAPRAGLSLAIACFVSNPAPTASNAIGVAVCAT